MNLRCYLVDDEPHAIKILKRYIDKTPGLALVGFTTNPMEARDNLVNKTITPDILFLDVAMPQISGIELAGLAKVMTAIIFTTAYPEYGFDAYENDAIDYLLKPISYERFLRSVAKVKGSLENHPSEKSLNHDSFCVKSEVKGRVVILKYDDVMYIQAKGNSSIIHRSHDTHTVYYSLTDLDNELPRERFIRIHKSYIVNLGKISAIDGNRVVLDDGKRLEIGSSYKSTLFNFINKILIIKKNDSNQNHPKTG